MRQVFIDLDGVLADFDGHYEACFGFRPNRALVDPPGFWENINRHPSFFRDLPIMRDARELWFGAQHAAIQYDNVFAPQILTGLPKSGNDQTPVHLQKLEWVEMYLGLQARSRTICCRSVDKKNYMRPGDVLIDDWEKYRHLWVEAGGVFILHTSAKKSLRQLLEVLQ